MYKRQYKSSIFGSDQIRSEELLLPLDSPRRGSAVVTLFYAMQPAKMDFGQDSKLNGGWWSWYDACMLYLLRMDLAARSETDSFKQS